MIQTATNKNEAFNKFIQWVFIIRFYFLKLPKMWENLTLEFPFECLLAEW
ncbi:MAG: hypothetical protein H0U27_15135 [Nitrosopumilus sp.]|nr:hypothetical protein [Nitrosopumilus sp.]